MTPDVLKRLRMFAGPNGSGKTSLVQQLVRNAAFHLHHFVNADDLFRDLQDGRGVSLAFLGQPATTQEVREYLAAGGRLRPKHPFLERVQVADAVLTGDPSACDAYVAAALADFFREQLLAAGRSFAFETVMSHASKVDFFAQARAVGYRTYLYFVCTDAPDLNIRRVKDRAALGGHDVPEDKIIERYERCLGLLGSALAHAHRAFLFDNSGEEPVWVAELTSEGKLQLKTATESLPDWFRKWVPHRA